MANIQNSRLIIKRSSTPGDVPTVGPSNDHTDGTWTDLDIYNGEFFINDPDEKLFYASNDVITEITAGGGGNTVIAQWDDVTIGTTTSTLNFEGGVSEAVDEGGGKSTFVFEKKYSQIATNLNGGTVNAAFGSPLECVPSSGTLEITVAETGDYLIYGMINIGTDLNKDSGAIELIYGIDTGSGAVIGPVPYSQNGQHKKNKANGIPGTWLDVHLEAGDVVVLFLSTLGDSTTWTEGQLSIATWK